MTEPLTRIGILIDAVHELYQAGIFEGIVAQAKQRHVDLIAFVAETQDGTAHFDAGMAQPLFRHHEMTIDFATRAGLDGVIIAAGPIAHAQGKEYLEQLCKRFGDTPLVCIAENVPGYHSVLVDNAGGIEDVIEHLVTVHNLRSIAFIAGPDENDEAEERFQAYREGLAKNNLPFRPELVQKGGFCTETGACAARELLQKNIEFDGIVAVNDFAAIGAMTELARQGVLIPTDVAVTGFDDTVEAALVTPSLATIRQPLERLGEAAVDNILSQMGKLDFILNARLPTEPIYRRSCGCFSTSVLRSRTSQVPIEEISQEGVVNHLWRIARENVNRTAEGYPGDTALRELIESLVGSLVWDVQRPIIRHIFLNEVDILLYRAEQFCDDTAQLIFMLLRELSVHVGALFEPADQIGEANNLLEQAGAFVREQLAGQARRSHVIEDQTALLVRTTSQRIVQCFDIDKLRRSLAIGLPELGIRSFALWWFNDAISPEEWKMPENAELVWAFRVEDGMETVSMADQQMDASLMMPDMIRPSDASSAYLFMPYHAENRYLGYAMYEYSPSAPLSVYEILRGHITAAMRYCSLKRLADVAFAEGQVDRLSGQRKNASVVPSS